MAVSLHGAFEVLGVRVCADEDEKRVCGKLLLLTCRGIQDRDGLEPFAPGGPTAAVPPASWTRYGQWLRRPVGPIHWAGTETADEWTGFLDGAVRSGQRAAAEVAQRLSR